MSWRRVDCTRGCHHPLGNLILDPENVSAALTLASKCSTLVSPWWMRHPQSSRMFFLEMSR